MDASKHLVSVIIPTIVINDYLRNAIDSILRQTYKSLEIIIVFDGALVPDVLPTWLQDPRLRIITHEVNQGTPLALNSGIGAAKGEFIARLDADDIALEGRIQAQVKYLLENPSVVCVGTGSVLINSQGKSIQGSETKLLSGYVTHELLTRNPLLHSSVMYRTDIVRSIGGYSPVMRRMQDYELYLRLARKGEIAVLSGIFAAYRVHDNQHSRNTSPWTPYTRLILKRRWELAQSLGASSISQTLRNVAWFTGQVARHYGVIRPRYLRKVKI